MTNVNSNESATNLLPTSLKEWVINTFSREEIVTICNGNADGKVYKLTYSWETSPIYNKYNKEIWTLLHSDADDMGYSVFEVIGHLKDAKNVTSKDCFEKLLVIYAVERIAVRYMIMENAKILAERGKL
jgi:hypothetical protein